MALHDYIPKGYHRRGTHMKYIRRAKGGLQFQCLYDGKHYSRCSTNKYGWCSSIYLFIPILMLHGFDGKNIIKCPCG